MADHPLRTIQSYCLEKTGHTSVIVQEYYKLTTKEAVIKSAQTTLNCLCDYIRAVVNNNVDEFRGDLNAIYCISRHHQKTAHLK